MLPLYKLAVDLRAEFESEIDARGLCLSRTKRGGYTVRRSSGKGRIDMFYSDDEGGGLGLIYSSLWVLGRANKELFREVEGIVFEVGGEVYDPASEDAR